MHICFIIPTFNEVDNLPTVIEALQRESKSCPEHRISILIVDDESSDGTAELAQNFADLHPDIHLSSGPKRGLGDAYTRGFSWVATHLQVDAIVQMDADLSHDPAAAFELIDKLDRHDVVIGSRYTSGGRIDEAWNFTRRALSWLGNVMARQIAGVYGIRDATSGFRVIRWSALRAVLPLEVNAQGYVFQVALLTALVRSGATVTEHPIYFKDRARGETKLESRDLIEFAIQVWWVRLQSKRVFIKFAITGAIGTMVNLITFMLLAQTGLPPWLCSALAIETSIINNFFLNNFWTFRRRNLAGRTRIRGLKFNLVSLISLSVGLATFVTLDALFPDQSDLYWQLASILPTTAFNYFANSYWTFKQP